MRDPVLTTRSALEFYQWRGANWQSPLRYPPLATCFCLPSKRRGGGTPANAVVGGMFTSADLLYSLVVVLRLKYPSTKEEHNE